MSTPDTEAEGTLSVTTPGEREIRTERIFRASRQRVWQAFTNPDEVAQWWGRDHRLVVERLDVEPGGRWRFVEHAPDGVFGFEGRFREVVPHERLVQTFQWDGNPGHEVVTTTDFEELGDDLTKVITTSVFHTIEERDEMVALGMANGLRESYAALDRLLARRST
jgi:uncharacterized protein YndB with AHSA1/START domain